MPTNYMKYRIEILRTYSNTILDLLWFSNIKDKEEKEALRIVMKERNLLK